MESMVLVRCYSGLGTSILEQSVPIELGDKYPTHRIFNQWVVVLWNRTPSDESVLVSIFLIEYFLNPPHPSSRSKLSRHN